MLLPGFAWLKRLLPLSRRDRARLAQFDHTRAGMVMVAGLLRDLAAQHDAHAHLVGKAARASRGGLAEVAAPSPVRQLLLAHTAEAMARAKATAADLDSAVEALERLAAGLRDG